jgi:SAM-dependent methyltransferase
LLFALTLLVSASLLFLVEPMFARMVLPRLGGSPAVWNTCLVFYQAVLLAGYVYAHVTTRWLGPRRQAALHLLVLLLPWLVLPIAIRGLGMPSGGSSPIPWLLGILALSVGLPFFVLAASAPVLQTWFAQTGDGAAKDPYFLYGASNLGSLLGLLGYPLLLEPWLRLGVQAWVWTAGYGLLMLLTAVSAVVLWRSPQPAPASSGTDNAASGLPQTEDASPTFARRLHWLVLALIPSSLLLGVTAYVSTDIAAVPLVWVIPLAIYLLSFVQVFARRRTFENLPVAGRVVLRGLQAVMLPSHGLVVRLQPLLVVLVAATFYFSPYLTVPVRMGVHLGMFYLTALVCHGELARLRPAARHLTEFYLWLSLGGVLGGLFNVMLAPLLFSTVVEYPVMIVAACFVRPRQKTVVPPRWWLHPAVISLAALAAAVMAYQGGFRQFNLGPNVGALTMETVIVALVGLVAFGVSDRPWLFGLAVPNVLLAGLFLSPSPGQVVYRDRSFFGVFRVVRNEQDQTMVLYHGSTIHGVQSLRPERRNQPLSYYYHTGPLGQLLAARAIHWDREIAVVGLGSGTIAAYGRPGQRFTFYEIDPTVERLARNPKLFSYLSGSRAKIRVVLGDARLSLGDAPDGTYGVIVLDAFTSDAIPLHLMTREALAMYCRKLAPGGVLALHISNRYMDLEPVLGRLADDAGLAAMVEYDGHLTAADRRDGKMASTWVVMARRKEDFRSLLADDRWESISVSKETPLWTDDFSNILAVLIKPW